MTPIWASEAVLPPGSISPIAQFAPAGSVYTVRTLRAQPHTCATTQPKSSDHHCLAKTAGLTSQSSNTQSVSENFTVGFLVFDRRRLLHMHWSRAQP